MGQLSALIQGIWSASVPDFRTEPITKSLYSDAGSGLLFHLDGEVKIGDKWLPQGIVILPINKISEKVTLSPGSQLAGLRFLPAIGYGLVEQHFTSPTLLTADIGHLHELDVLYATLQLETENQGRIEMLHKWASKSFQRSNIIPNSLKQVLKCIDHDAKLQGVDELVALSQRQIERLFKHWMDISPKQYQRILRVQRTVNYLRQNKGASLVDVSQQFGFSDQAHMTREFRAIACITPGKV
ncbi:AraC family transcriptional regulator [Vibrio mimicus]